MGGQVLGSLNIQPGGSHPSCGFWLPVWLYSLKKIIFFLSLKILVYLFLAVLGLCCCRQAFSSCGARPSCDGSSARGTVSRCTGSVVVALRLSCSEACGIFLDQGSNPFPLAGRFLTTGPPGKPPITALLISYTPIQNKKVFFLKRNRYLILRRGQHLISF